MSKNRIKKQHIGILTAILAIAMVSVIGISTSYANDQDFDSTSPKITKGEATQIAVNKLGTDIANLVEVDVDKENGTFLYSVDFIIGEQEISVEIDPQTGDILAIESEPIGSPDTDNDGDYDDINDD